MEKAMAVDVANRIKNQDRNGRAQIYNISDGSGASDKEFWEILGTPTKKDKVINPVSAEDDDEEEDNDNNSGVERAPCGPIPLLSKRTRIAPGDAHDESTTDAFWVAFDRVVVRKTFIGTTSKDIVCLYIILMFVKSC